MTKFITIKSTNQEIYCINIDHIKLVNFKSDGQKNYLTEIHVDNYRIDTYEPNVKSKLGLE